MIDHGKKCRDPKIFPPSKSSVFRIAIISTELHTFLFLSLGNFFVHRLIFKTIFELTLSPQYPQKHLLKTGDIIIHIHICALQLYACLIKPFMTTDQNTSKMQFSTVFNLDKIPLASCRALAVLSRCSVNCSKTIHIFSYPQLSAFEASEWVAHLGSLRYLPTDRPSRALTKSLTDELMQ